MRDLNAPEAREAGPEGPFQAIPAAVVALAVVVLGIEGLFSLGARGVIGGPDAVGWRLSAITDYGFLIPVFDWMRATGIWPMEQLVRFVSYPLIHLGFTHALFGVVLLLAIGKLVAEAFGQAAFAVLFVAGSVTGALLYGLLIDENYPLVGVYPGVFALIGGFSFLMWTDPGQVGAARWRAFGLVAALIGIQLLFRLLFGGSNDWVADLGGFGAGFALSFVLAPGALARLIARMRDR
ncbi:MAG: rhomboid family intramembrane serine protease [Rhodobacteraceae bacterium]|nr:rhomboid family intramembrane serine protease [Paracoccaceae bacterium]